MAALCYHNRRAKGFVLKEKVMRIWGAFLTAGALAALPFAQAQAQVPVATPPYGFYVGVEGGWSHMLDVSSSAGNTAFTVSLDEGFAGGGVVGYSFGGFRLEGEVVDRQNDLDNFTATTTFNNGNQRNFNGGASGDINILAGMVNVFYDFLPLNALHPYIGAGVGGARVALDSVGFNNVPVTSQASIAAAYQGIIGVSYFFNPNVSASLDYRYFGTAGENFTNVAGHSFNLDTGSHNVLLGLQYHFWEPPAAPPPPAATRAMAPAAPPPLVERKYIVFFDFDKASLTAAGARIVESAAETFKATGSAKIDLTGYTDLAGTQAYNLKLSERRAETVRNYLVKLGVPADEIGVSWRGKENPRVPTPDGVREPQNRRVEIVMP
jgi:outer membrane protein OmpA-like peptidoglycan-associated protein